MMDFASVTKMFQGNAKPLADVRIIFDSIIDKYTTLTGCLRESVSIVLNQEF